MERNELTEAMPSAFFSSFIAGEPLALSFLPADFRSGDARIDRVRRAARRRIAPGLLEVLERQNRDYAPSTAREANLSALGSPGAVAVVTGQQVGLFLGPLYAFYKAASA
ncbi:MAG TPA: bacillithiol biosynthesis BshC, partial [Myxococcales bacterium]